MCFLWRQERPDLTQEEIQMLDRKMGSDKKYTQKQMFREEIGNCLNLIHEHERAVHDIFCPRLIFFSVPLT